MAKALLTQQALACPLQLQEVEIVYLLALTVASSIQNPQAETACTGAASRLIAPRVAY
jgi:hypothetical protein